MNSVEETPYGYRITFDGFLERETAGVWLQDLKRTIQHRAGFGVLVDMRAAKAFPAEAQEILKQGIHYCLKHGMERNAVVLSSAIITLQVRRLVKETAIDSWVRFIDASSEPDWERISLDWLLHGIEPAAK